MQHVGRQEMFNYNLIHMHIYFLLECECERLVVLYANHV